MSTNMNTIPTDITTATGPWVTAGNRTTWVYDIPADCCTWGFCRDRATHMSAAMYAGGIELRAMCKEHAETMVRSLPGRYGNDAPGAVFLLPTERPQ